MKKTLLLFTFLAAGFAAGAQVVTSLTPGYKNDTSLTKGQNHLYQVRVNKGEFFDMELMQKGVDVIIDVFDNQRHKLKSFDSTNGTAGPELVKFEAPSAGVFRLEVHPFNDSAGMPASAYAAMMESNQGKYAIRSVKVLSAKEYRQKVAEENQQAQKVVQWLSANVIPFSTVNAGNGFNDLQPLKQILKDVKYVGLGEATHGTREFFQMKHRMLEFLVKELDFRVFAIEASYAGCVNINDYVMYGKGDAHTALASQGFWTWDTEEVIDLIEWMRTYNQSVSSDRKVKFAGFDIQVNTKGGGVKKIKDYLQKVDSTRFLEMRTLLDSTESMENSPQKDSVVKMYNAFLSFFTMSKGNYVQRSSPEEYEDALAYCRVLGQLVDAYFMKDNDPRKREREWRDYYMASNFIDLVVHEKPGTKMVLWAHNGHISHNAGGFVNGGLKPFGSYLKEAYGPAYYAFGFEFNQGGFQSMEIDSTGKYKGLQEFVAKPATEKSCAWYFAQTNKPLLIFNIQNIELPGFMIDFVTSPVPTRDFGAATIRNLIDQPNGVVTLKEDFDGIIFIGETHRSRATETGKR
jgi:erythromycin esterase